MLARQDDFPPPSSPCLRGWLLGLLLLVAAAVRVYAAFNDLWLDEIWSLRLASQVSSPWQVFTHIHHDNNDYLNTLWLYVCGARGNWPGYRFPSIVAGAAAVVLAGMIVRRRSARAALFAMLLVSFSYVQILYSSEARGYAAVVFFSFLSFYALEKYMEKQEWRSALIFSISSILGFASHLIYLNFFCSAIVWSGWRFIKSGDGLKQAIRSMLACHAGPAAFLLWIYIVDIRYLAVGGGAKSSLLKIYANSLAWTLGGFPGQLLMVSTIILAIALFVAGLWILWREKSDSWIFFIGVVVVFPILFAILHKSDAIYVRHFIVGMAFLLLLFSLVLATIEARGPQGQALCVVLLVGYFALNGLQTVSLFKYGRGQYSEAARFLAEYTKQPMVTVGGDHDLRIPVVLQFYVKDAMGNKTERYYPRNSWPPGGPEWVICHKESFEYPVPPARQFTDAASNSYEFIETFQTAPLSGLHWFIYHNRAK